MNLDPNQWLERSQWDFFWVPGDVELLDRPDLAALRSERPLPHLNCVTRTRCSRDALPAIADEVTRFHRHGVSRWLVPNTFETGPLTSALSAAGYVPRQRHEARCIRPQDYRPRPTGNLEVHPVRSLQTLRDCVDVMRRGFGWSREYSREELRQELAQCGDPGARVQRFVVYRKGAPVSSGGLNWFPDLALGFLWAGATIPEARGEGAYSALVAARIQHAHRRGAEWVGLYAAEQTSAPVVARQGFELVGEMTFWERETGLGAR